MSLKSRALWFAFASAIPFSAAHSDLPVGDYFLSRTNPIANVDQRDIERRAVRLLARSDIQAACSVAKEAWARVTDRLMPPDQWSRYPQAMSDYCFKSVIVAVNTDANYPKVLRVMLPEHRWFGLDVPGEKWGGDNADNAYRIISIAPGKRYVVEGQRQRPASTYVTFQIVGDSNTSQTLGSLEQRDMEIRPDGSYTLTLDATPAGDRKNHLQIPEHALYLFIRDSMSDWATQSPDALRVRLLDPPSRTPLTDDEIAETAIRNIRYDLYYQYFAARLFFNSPQTMSRPSLAGSVGGLVTQQGSLGHFKLDSDEVAVITTERGDADYHSIHLHDLWLRTLDYRNGQNSLNNAQMTPDSDGRYTFVISQRDPGVANWLDNAGLGDVLVLYRWQGFPASGSKHNPTISSRIVKFAELGRALPAGVARITPTQRRAQLNARAKAYDRRFEEN